MPTNELNQAKSRMNLDRFRLHMLDGRMTDTGNLLVSLNRSMENCQLESSKKRYMERIEKLEAEQDEIMHSMNNILKRYNVHYRQRGYMAVWHKQHKLCFTIKFADDTYPFKRNTSTPVQEG